MMKIKIVAMLMIQETTTSDDSRPWTNRPVRRLIASTVHTLLASASGTLFWICATDLQGQFNRRGARPGDGGNGTESAKTSSVSASPMQMALQTWQGVHLARLWATVRWLISKSRTQSSRELVKPRAVKYPGTTSAIGKSTLTLIWSTTWASKEITIQWRKQLNWK